MKSLRNMTAVCMGLFVGSVCGAGAADLTDSVSMKGDIRNRYEWISAEGRDTRTRFRIRARLALKAVVTEEVDTHLRLSTGNDDPVSGNQTFGDAFTRKEFGLDRAYVDWHPAAMPGLNLYLGKMVQPWVTVKDLVWDGDLNPEGFALNYTPEFEAVDVLFHLGAFQVEERSSDDDTWLASAQAAVTFKPADMASLQAGASYYFYSEIQGRTTLFDPEDGFGNSTVAVVEDGEETGELVYASDFQEVEGFAMLKLDTAIPTKVYGDYVVNTEADENDTGFMVGATLGTAKDPGSWQLDYNFRDLEADAVVAVFTDSDSSGGGTGYDGHRFQVKYQLSKALQLSGTFFHDTSDARAEDFRRSQVDLIAKF